MILVSGLPRSGTSMIMQMLEAGGVEILCDGERAADEDNPKGYYELEAVKGTKDDPSWLDGARGKAVKLISQLLYDLPEGTPCKVIFLRREMGEILASQRKMLERRGGGGAEGGGGSDVEDAEMSRIFETHLTEVLAWAKQRVGLELL
ncbi:MAG TPA: sulfotransferase family protein, partial [Candidatus Latescibacteria bacterium]|nr:sulfotransferase family protein [Candidatus Latescibacterota bacterium]